MDAKRTPGLPDPELVHSVPSRAVAGCPIGCLPEETTIDFSIRVMPSVERLPSSPLRQQICSFAILRINWDRVPKTRVALYREEDGSCPFVEWFDKLPAKVQDKC